MTIGNPRYNAASTATTGSTLHSTQSTGDHATGQSESTRPLKRSGSKQRFEIVRKLGSGTYGKVSLAIDHRTGEQVAIKIIKKFAIENAQDLLRIKREIRIMSALRHPNIIEIKEVFENDEKIVIVMEYASGGELYDYVNNFGPLSEAEVRRTFRQIVSAVYFCHKNHVTHRDLKLENILLDKKMNAKIADFGLSNYFSDTDMLRTFCGSPLYASPEIINGIPYRGPEVDCWSLGVLLYSLAYSSMPFDGRDFNRMIRQIKRGIYYEPDNPSSASTLIRIMLRVSTDRRATIDDIANHWWLNFDVEGPPIKDLPENQVNKRRVEPTPGGTAELQVQTFNNENEIFAEFMHLNAATRKRVEEFRKKRKEADAFLSKTRDVAKNVDESTAGGDPFARLQALEQQLHSLSRKPSEKEQQPSKSTKTQSCTPNRESRPIDLQLNSKIELTEEEQTQSAIEQSILAEGNRLANQLVEEQTRGQVSSELIEKIRKTHEQYGIDVLKELLDSVLHSQQTGQETLKGQDIMVDSTHRASSTVQKSDLPDLVKVQARKQPLSQSQTGPDILQQKTKTIPTTQGNNESENDDEEEEEQDVISVEFDDIDDEDNQDKTSSSSKSTLADSIGESLPMESVPPEADGQVELMTSSVSKQTTLNDNDDVSEKSEYSVGLSKRQSRGKYERSKFLFGREIAIEESPRPSRKRVGGVQPEVKDAPALFDKAKKYILQYPDALGSTESMQLVATKQQIIQSIENAPDDQPKATTTTTTAEPRQYTDGRGQSKLYKVLWPRASIELEADEDAQSSVQQVNTAETKNELDTFQKGPTSSEQTKDEEMAEEENRATTEILVSQNDEPLAKETEADNGQTLENRYHGVSFGVSQQLQGIQGRAPSRDQATAPTRTSTTAEKSTAFTHQPYDYRRSVYTSPLASTVGRYGDTSAIHGKADTYRPYISSVYPYFGRSTYRSQLESRDSQEPKSPGAYKQGDRRFLYSRMSYPSALDEKSGTDVLSDYASKFDQRSYGRSRYSSNDYPKRVATHESSSHHYVASRSGGNRSHSLYELSVPAKRFSIAYAAPSSGAGETDLRLSYDQPRRRARSLYDTTDSSGHTDYYYTPKIRDSTALSYSSAAAEKPMTSTNYGKSSNDKYNFRTDDNITYRRSLYDVENDIGGSGVSALQRYHQGSGRGLAKARAQSLDKYTSDGLATDTNTYFSTVSKPYVYPVYGHTVYQETAGNSMQDYPKSPPDASVQPIKGILKKKPVSSTSSTPTDDDSGYSSVPAADSHITGGSRTDKAIKGSSYLNWRAKSPSKTFNIMERIRRRINNNEREGGATVDTDVGGSITNYKSSSILDDRPVSSTGTISAATKYSKWSGPQSTTTSYLSSSNSPMKEKEVSALESLEKNQKPRKKRNLWNLGRRRTVELPFQSSASSNEDSAYFKRPSSPLEKLKGFFVSTTTPATDSSKSRSFGYPSSSSSSVSSKLKDRSSYSPLDAPSGYTSAGNAVSYRKFTKVGAVRPHSSYGSTTHSWYEDNPLY